MMSMPIYCMDNFTLYPKTVDVDNKTGIPDSDFESFRLVDFEFRNATYNRLVNN